MTDVIMERISHSYAVSFAFNRSVVETLKSAVPSPSRQWRPTEKRWLIEPTWVHILARNLVAAGHRVELDGKPFENAAPAANSMERREPFAVQLRAVLDQVPADQRRRVIKVVAAALHPDRGGDSELAREAIALLEEVTP